MFNFNLSVKIYRSINLFNDRFTSKNNGLLPRILAGQKKHIRPFLLLDFKAAHIYANNKVKLRQEGGRELRNEQMHYYQ